MCRIRVRVSSNATLDRILSRVATWYPPRKYRGGFGASVVVIWIVFVLLFALMESECNRLSP